MAGYTIHLPEEDNIVLSAATVRRLVAAGSGDAALLYLALLQNRGSMDPTRLIHELGWTEGRLSAAEHILFSCGLAGTGKETPQERRDERPEYTREDVSHQLKEDRRFSQLTASMEQLLGKKLSTADLNILLGLYDYLGLPEDVIFLLANHCTERITARYGPGRRPTLRQIEKEGYVWARMGLMDLDSANRHLMKYAQKKDQTNRYMAALRLGERSLSPSEERYLLSWAEMGFPAETVELAYDRTMLQCKELRWPYLNKILLNWHKAGLHTLQEVEEGDRRTAPQSSGTAQPPLNAADNLARMRKYLQEMKK